MKSLTLVLLIALIATSFTDAKSGKRPGRKPARRPPQVDFSKPNLELNGEDGSPALTISEHQDLDRHYYYSGSCQQPTATSDNQLQPGEIYEVTSPNYPDAYNSQDSDLTFDIGENLDVQVECEEFSIRPPSYYYNTRECFDAVRMYRPYAYPYQNYNYWSFSFCGKMLAGRTLRFRSYSNPWKFHFAFTSNSYIYQGAYKCYLQVINANTETTDAPEVTTSVPDVTTPDIVESTTEIIVTTPVAPSETTTAAVETTPVAPETTSSTPVETTASVPDPTTVTSEDKCPCGHDPNAANRIVGGEEVTANENPWQVGIAGRCRPGYYCYRDTFCGGTIIDNCYILTAAHCIDGKSLDVIIGDHSTNAREGTEIRIPVETITVHSGYNNKTVDNDYALLKLETCLTDEQMAENHIEAACLPQSDPKPTGATGQLSGTVSGWGTTSSGGSQSYILKEEDITIYSDEKCRSSVGLAYNPETMMCAGTLGAEGDACQGDSGGPLVSTIDGKVTLVGVVSWGYSCDANTPGVYADVYAVSQWIADNTPASDCI